MWKYTYGEFSDTQVSAVKTQMRKQIYFLLLCVDKNTRDAYKDINVNAAIKGTMRWFGGLNDLLGQPPELVRIQSLLRAALTEYNDPDFRWQEYRRLILAAGNLVLEIEEVDSDA